MPRSYKFRLYPKEKEEAVLDDSLREARSICNKLLERRISKYSEEGTGVDKYSMYPIIKDLIKENNIDDILYSHS